MTPWPSGFETRGSKIDVDALPTSVFDSIAHYRHKAKLADGISDGIVRSAFLKLELHQRVKTPGDY
jgi:hypothetical protein